MPNLKGNYDKNDEYNVIAYQINNSLYQGVRQKYFFAYRVVAFNEKFTKFLYKWPFYIERIPASISHYNLF